MSDETIVDPGLSQLREQTKNVMIPLLIKAFELKSEAGRLTDLPSRLTASHPKSTLEEIVLQLSSLNKDLELQQLWIESSKKQIEKILTELQQEPQAASLVGQIKPNGKAHPAAAQSFQNIFSVLKSPSIKSPLSIRSWWKKISGNK